MKVLIVDDDMIFTMMHCLLIKNSGISTDPHTFSDGKSALDFIINDTDPDTEYLILLDINMPGMNGWQFLEKTTNQHFSPRLSVAMVTSSIAPEDINKAREFPQVVDYITKPFSTKSCERLKELLFTK